MIPSRQVVIEAHNRIKEHINETPIHTSSSLNKMFNCRLYFKCENFQKVGAFKFRGATNAVRQLSAEQLLQGVATHSSGNHAAALALSAKLLDIPSYIVMPETAPKIKVKAVEGYNAKITFCKPTQEAREETLEKIIEETGATFIHPYNNYNIIAGQATATKELIQLSQNHFDIIVAPVGGGGLLSGTSLSAKYFSDETIVIGAEPKGADDAYRSLQDGKIYPSIKPNTIADGLLTSLCEKTYEIIKENVDQIITVEEETIINAMRIIWERMKIIVEPSSAVVLAAIMENKELFEGKNVGLIISGGNIDLDKLPWH